MKKGHAKEHYKKISHKIKHHFKNSVKHIRHISHKKKEAGRIDSIVLVQKQNGNVVNTEHLNQYVENALKHGFKEQKIRALCLSAGWSSYEIESAFSKIGHKKSKLDFYMDKAKETLAEGMAEIGRMRERASKKKIRPAKRRIKPNIQKSFAIILIILLLAYAIFFGNIIKRNCGTDINCFDRLASRCTGAKLETIKDTNTYEYSVKGTFGKNCIIDVKLKSMAVGTPVNIASKLEGKGMECKIPKALLMEKGINDIEDLMAYCSGMLKESVYEVIMDDMYSLIIKNIGNITKIVEKDISKFSTQAL